MLIKNHVTLQNGHTQLKNHSANTVRFPMSKWRFLGQGVITLNINEKLAI